MDAPPRPPDALHRPSTALTVQRPVPWLRSAVAGVLMGLANLVPGVSGGTMIVVMGLYDDFIAALADLSRLRFARRHFLFLGVVGAFALAAIALFAGALGQAVAMHRSAMFALFIGMTLGGAPLLLRMVGRPTPGAWLGGVLGLTFMVIVALTNGGGAGHSEAAGEAASLVLQPAYSRDVVAGLLGMSAMVLPGISGAYVLLLLGRYEMILLAIDVAKDELLGLLRGREAVDLANSLGVLVPTAIGSVISLAGLSNVLKWMLQRFRPFTLGLLLGIVVGSIVGIWPFRGGTSAAAYAVGAALSLAGFVATFLLSRIKAE